MPMPFLPLIFLVWPLAEIACFVLIGSRIGVMATIALVLLAGFAGMALLRWLGFASVMQLRSKVGNGALAGREIANSAMLAMAALFLILPGFISDVFGLLLLVPVVRDFIWRHVAARAVVVARPGSGDGQGRPRVVELEPGEFSVRDEKRPSGGTDA